jgi:hypothetical protein
VGVQVRDSGVGRAVSGVVAMWVRSYWVSDEFRWTRLVDDPTRIRSITDDWGRIISVDTGRGRAGVLTIVDGGARPSVVPAGFSHVSGPAGDISPPYSFGSRVSMWGRLGFHHEEVFGGDEYTVPLWPIVVAAGFFPALACWRWLRKRRTRRKGRCPICGYNLRATPGRGPECGAFPKAKAAT